MLDFYIGDVEDLRESDWTGSHRATSYDANLYTRVSGYNMENRDLTRDRWVG